MSTGKSQPSDPPFQWKLGKPRFPLGRWALGLGFSCPHWTPMMDSILLQRHLWCPDDRQGRKWDDMRLVSFEPPRDKTNKMACAPREDSDQPGHLPSLIWVFAVCMKKAWVLSYPLSAQRRLWSDWADAQSDLSLRWAHMPLCWFCHEAAHLSSWENCNMQLTGNFRNSTMARGQ